MISPLHYRRRAHCLLIPLAMLATIYSYSDYCAVLKDFFQQKKQRNPSFSYGVWARQLGLKSPATLTMLLKGQRSPSDSLVVRLCENLKLQEREKEYFQDLVRLKKTTDDLTLNVLVMERMGTYYPEGQTKLIDLETFRAISNWYFYAIREMVLLADFQEDPEWISNRLGGAIDASHCENALSMLQRLGLLSRTKEGKLVQASGYYNTPDGERASEAVKRFHEGTLDLAKASLRQISPEDREVNGVTFGIKRKNIGKAKSLMRKFQKQFCKLIEEKDADEVYHLQMAFFPLTRKITK